MSPEPTGHEELGVLIEKRIRAEESPEERTRLDQHVQGCEKCRASLDAAVRAVRAVQARVEVAARDVKWDTVERHWKAEASHARTRGLMLALAGVAGAAVTLALAPLGPPNSMSGAAWRAGVLLGVLVCVGGALWLRARMLGRRVAADAANLERAWERELRRRRRAFECGMALLAVWTAATLVVPMLVPAVRPVWVFLVMIGFFWTKALSQEARRRRRLYHEGLIDAKRYASRTPVNVLEAEVGR